MSIELVLWTGLAVIGALGGVTALAAIWSLVKAPKQ